MAATPLTTDEIKSLDGTGRSSAFGAKASVWKIGTLLAALVTMANTAEADLAALPLDAVSLAEPASKTLSGGAFTPTTSLTLLDTEAAAASDDLDTITVAGDIGRGSVQFLTPASGARTVVVKHGTGNISCPGGADISLADAGDMIMAVLDEAETTWNVLAYKTLVAGNGGFASILASTSASKGASLVGIQDSAATITATTVEAALAELSARVRSQLCTVTAVAAAEAADNIDITINLVDLAGTAVSRAQKLICEVLKADLTPATASEYRLSETGAGSEVSTTGKPSMIIATDASGDATLRVHDQAGASNASVYVRITPVGVSGTYTLGTPTYVAITFDAA